MIRVVNEHKEFKFKNLCPYCGGNLSYRVEGWVVDDGKYPRKLKKQLRKKYDWPLWIADSLGTADCSNEPEDMESLEWDDFMRQHTYMPYMEQLPVDNRVEKYIRKRYRFNLQW